jgi:proton-translocating NADH-quinone oxidoreductase chain L
MSETPLLWLIPGLPLLGAIIAGFFGPRLLREKSHWPVVLGCAGACAVVLWALVRLIGMEHDEVHRITAPAVNWFTAGNVSVSYSIAIDPLTAIMLTAITFIGTWIAIFSIGYMHGDPGYPRFFAVLSLFVFAMCILVLADNLILLYAGWEGVGLCSYLLIGFWFAKPAAATAARKAFLMTRIGDAGMILGIFLLWVSLGNKLDYESLFAAARTADPVRLNAACLLLFCGAVGKSAQFPLHTWLPDAMEGPTPASALIHAATMVTAGVYLVARCMPLFHYAPTAQATVGVIAIITALLAALIALTQHDLKRVMAYSTVSQLAMMFLGLAGGRGHLAVLGVTAGIFHLFTHAFFKALLFLASGSVMHAMGNVIDMRRIGGLRKVLPITHATFLCGALALAAVPPMSGFWSKDEVVDLEWDAATHLPDQHMFFLVLFVLAMVTALLTAFYTFRAYFRTFWGPEMIPAEAGSHGHGEPAAGDHHGDSHHVPVAHARDTPGAVGVAHESPPVMYIPLIVLAVGAVTVGGLIGPTHWIGHFLAQTPAYLQHLPEGHTTLLNWPLMAGSAVVAFTGIGLAYLLYIRNPGTEARFAARFPSVYNLSQNRFYFDELYTGIVTLPATALAKLSTFFDMLVDGIVDLVGLVPSLIGTWLRPMQNGLVQFYALAMVLGLTVFLCILTLRGGR